MASEEEIAKQAVEDYTSVTADIVGPMASLLPVSLMYGMYIIIFGLCINVLWQRRDSPASRAYTRWIIALFVLETISIASAVWMQVGHALIGFNAIKTQDYIPLFKAISSTSPYEWAARFGLGIFSSYLVGIIYEYLLIHRCYVIWGYSKRILYPFAFVVIVTGTIIFVASAVEIATYHHDPVLYRESAHIGAVAAMVSTVNDTLLTLLTAGRIWWIARQAGRLAGRNVYSKYKIIIATILETGLICSFTSLAGDVLELVLDPERKGLVPFDTSGIAFLSSGIAPTIIVVRIAYGQSVDSVQQMLSTLQFAEGEHNSTQQRSAAVRDTVDLRRSLVGAEGRDIMGRLEIVKSPSNMDGGAV
ncbi:hypothetical protein PM082_021175 [Marasmius tenuissimus]|nr:hypothetical protein PM082_021175 [Marasmius tenuissimus]